jgi:localization factor PodJL
MSQAAPWSVKGIEQEARDAAKEAARRAGMTLGDWLNNAIAEQAGDIADEPETHVGGPSSSGPGNDLVRALEAVTRLAELSSDRRRTQAEFEGEERRNPQSTGRRDHDDRVLDILQSVERRLGQLEDPASRNVRSEIDPAMGMMAEALRTIGSRLDRIDSTASSRDSAVLADRLSQRIDSIRSAMQAAQATPTRPGFAAKRTPFPVKDIAARQAALEGVMPRAGLDATSPAIEARLDALSRSLDTLRATPAAPSVIKVDLKPLEDKLAVLTARIERIGAAAPELGPSHINALTERLDALRDDFARTPVPLPAVEGDEDFARVVGGQLADMRQMMGRLASRDNVDQLANGLAALAHKVEETEERVTRAVEQRLSQQIVDQAQSSSLFSDGLADALNDIARKLDHPLRASGSDQTAVLLETVTERLERLATQIERLDTNAPRGPTTGAAPAARAPSAPPKIVLPRPRAPEPVAPQPLEPEDSAESLFAPPPRQGRDLTAERSLPPGEDDAPLEPGAAPPPRRAPGLGSGDSLQAARAAARAAVEEMARQSDGRSTRNLSNLLEEPAPAPSLIDRLKGLVPGRSQTTQTADDGARPVRPTLDVSLEPEDEHLKGKGKGQRKIMQIGLFVLILGIIAVQLSPVQLVPDSLRETLRSFLPFGQKTPGQNVSSLVPRQPAAPMETPKTVRQVDSKTADASATPSDDDGKGDVTASIPTTSTGKVVAPEGINVSQGWQSTERTPSKPTVSAKLPAALLSAAERGVPEAAFEMGNRYLEGNGVAQSPRDAALWYEKAATKGHIPAHYRLGSLYEKGNGVARDLDKAKAYYIRAGTGGNAKAMHNLAVMAAEGQGGRPNYKEAIGWFLKAAEYGIADSQFNLGILYARGLGVDANLAESYKWFALAASLGDKDAAKKRDDVAARLDAQTLSTAQLAARTFVLKKEPEEAVDSTSMATTSANSPAPPATRAPGNKT